MALGHAYDCLAVIEITRSNTAGTITGHFSVPITITVFHCRGAFNRVEARIGTKAFIQPVAG